MTGNGWFQIFLFFCLVLALTKPLGNFLYRVYDRKPTFLDPVLRPIERLIYRVCGVDDTREMDWKGYGISMLLFSGVSLLVLYLIELTHQWLPWNPQKLPNVAPDLAWNTAGSFTPKTNWQTYPPESPMSYFTQMAGLAYHNFSSAPVGIALAIAVIRGVARKEAKTIGNFWVDTTRSLLWILLPLCVILGLALVSQGVVQNLNPYTQANLVDPQTIDKLAADGTKSQDTVTIQMIAQGPVASQEAIKMLGTNGGGFFNANSAHPFENPTPLSNLLQMLMIFAIPSALTYTLGRMTGSARHGWAVWSAMAGLFLAGGFLAYPFESRGNPTLQGLNTVGSETQAGGKFGNKEIRFRPAGFPPFPRFASD